MHEFSCFINVCYYLLSQFPHSNDEDGVVNIHHIDLLPILLNLLVEHHSNAFILSITYNAQYYDAKLAKNLQSAAISGIYLNVFRQINGYGTTTFKYNSYLYMQTEEKTYSCPPHRYLISSSSPSHVQFIGNECPTHIVVRLLFGCCPLVVRFSTGQEPKKKRI